jgi:uncharacterized protein (TIGR00375 family)
MQIIADLQIHSKFSRAVSPEMQLPQIAGWARRKGIGLMATGDWTHPLWMREIKANLEEVGNGLLQLRAEVANKNLDPYFLLATEVSCIYSQGGKGRRVHTLVWVPSLASADKINKEMTKQGCNLMSDGRPIIGLTSIQVAELVLTIEPKALVIPAHAWTPWFSVYGSMSGFNSIDEAFGPYAKQIYAVETGLSSNPSMNWRIKELDHRTILSFSDAHSGPKIGREATVFDIPDGKLSYKAIYNAITQKGPSSVTYTIEFYPDEGKYHWSGHRACNIRWGPKEIEKNGNVCPVCGKNLTQGVEHRVSQLAGRSEDALRLTTLQNNKLTKARMIGSKAFPKRPPFVMLVPLQEILSEAIGSPVTSPKVQPVYTRLVDALGGEFHVLLHATHEEIASIAGERVAVGIDKVRSGDIHIDPGYDGVFGVVKIWRDNEEKPLVDASKEQLRIF